MVLEENGEDKWPEKVTNEEVLKRLGKKGILLHNIKVEKKHWLDVS
jgi:hypothetical protein